MTISQLIEKAKSANLYYRKGESIMTDQEYDELIEKIKELSPDSDAITSIGFKVEDSDSRKVKLPVGMFSLNKIKSIDDLHSWAKNKGFSKNEYVVISSKLDGLSLLVSEDDNEVASTRGDGVYGQISTSHYKKIPSKSKVNLSKEFKSIIYSYGEVVMSRKTFMDKWSIQFQNPRNLVAGQINTNEPTDILKDCEYIRYGLVGYDKKMFKTKSSIFEYLNTIQKTPIKFIVSKLSDLTEESLLSLFTEWNKSYEIDGLVIEVDNLELQEKLGRETSTSNPCYSRAYKGNFEEVGETEILSIDWQVSKQGLLKPVARLKPVRLDSSATVTNVTLNNALFVKTMGLGPGTIIKIKRSGGVIPLITKVVKSTGFQIPKCCTTCDSLLEWNDNNIELICINDECEGKIFKRIVSFFNILECKNVDEGVLSKIYDAGYDTIKKICELTEKDLLLLDGFGKRKAQIVYESISSGLKRSNKSTLGHASGLFKGLGSKKLALLSHFNKKPTVRDIININGFAETSAMAFIDGFDKFEKFKKELNITFDEILEKEVKQTSTGDKLSGKTFVFTGVRSKECEDIIVSNGGKIGTTVSKNSTHLVMKSKGSGSAKEVKAEELGLTILTLSELQDILGNL